MQPVALPERRAPYAVAARELLRDTLLDAGRDLLIERPWAEITMADVASAAGVSRQTLYSAFGSRAEFAQALVIREADRFLVTVEEALAQHLDDPATALSAAFEVFLTAASEDPLVRSVMTGDADGLLPLLTTQGGPVVDGAAGRLAAAMKSGWPHVGEQDADLLADCLVRLAISHAALPAGTANETAASVATLLAPYIERVVVDGAR